MMSNRHTGWRCVRLRVSSGCVILATAAWLGVALNVAAVQSPAAPAATAATPKAQLYESVYNGWKWWHVYCYRCHGQNAVGSTLAPNLTDPASKMTQKEFLKTVREGFPDQGMQAWAKLLDDKQIIQLYDYVIARTDKVLPPGRPDEVGPNGGPWVPPDGWPKRK